MSRAATAVVSALHFILEMVINVYVIVLYMYIYLLYVFHIHCMTLNHIMLQYATYHTLHLHCITLHQTTLQYGTVQYNIYIVHTCVGTASLCQLDPTDILRHIVSLYH